MALIANFISAFKNDARTLKEVVDRINVLLTTYTDMMSDGTWSPETVAAAFSAPDDATRFLRSVEAFQAAQGTMVTLRKALEDVVD